MGKALIVGLVKGFGSGRVAVWDKVPEAREGLAEGAEVMHPANWPACGYTPDALIIAVKPADVAGLVDEVVAPKLREGMDFLTVSIAAGIPMPFYLGALGGSARVSRVMPNTPAMIGEGMSAYSLSDGCSDEDGRLVERVFSACGKVIQVPESLMDAVTGLSGSGPAFVYSFIEALAEGGVSAGLPYKTALDAAVQTVIGAARMVQSSAEHPAALRARVMSPGGTTVRGLHALERGAFKGAVMSAVAEAAARSAEISKGK
jgi:pyrroline-5-carboxylate reductase